SVSSQIMLAMKMNPSSAGFCEAWSPKENGPLRRISGSPATRGHPRRLSTGSGSAPGSREKEDSVFGGGSESSSAQRGGAVSALNELVTLSQRPFSAHP